MAILDVVEVLKALFGGKKEASLIKITSKSDVENEELSDPKFKDRCVLVGVLRNKHQLKVMLKERFYHIPVEAASGCSFPVRYIAVYQSKKLFGNQCGIRYYGKVESCNTVERCKIREIPKSGKEKYLYFKVKNWVLLDKTVSAKDMEDVAFSTTPYLLVSCKNSSELRIRSKEEYLFHKNLMNTVKNMVRHRIADGEDIIYRDYKVVLKGGILCLYFCDVLQYAIDYDCYLDNSMNVTRDIFDYYPEL